jgi:integrase
MKTETTRSARRAGQIIKRGDNWQVRIYTGRGPDGRREYINKTIKGNKKDAQTYLSATLSAISTGTFARPSPLTLSAYLDKWLAASKARVRPTTLASYKFLIQNYIKPHIGTMRLSDLRSLHVQALYATMESELKLGPRTIKYTHSVLSGALKQACHWNMLAINPADGATLPRQVRRDMQALDPKQAQAFLAGCERDTGGVALMLALSTGMRPCEYLGLQWSDVDLEGGQVTVNHSLTWGKGEGWTLTEPKTPRSKRTIPLPASMTRLLVDHRRRQNEARLKAGKGYENHGFVFAMPHGVPVRLRYLDRYHYKPTLKRAGLPTTMRVYDLRHSSATLLLAAGENVKVISERLGHASVTLTLDVYSHVLPGQQEAASAKLERLFA